VSVFMIPAGSLCSLRRRAPPSGGLASGLSARARTCVPGAYQHLCPWECSSTDLFAPQAYPHHRSGGCTGSTGKHPRRVERPGRMARSQAAGRPRPASEGTQPRRGDNKTKEGMRGRRLFPAGFAHLVTNTLPVTPDKSSAALPTWQMSGVFP